MWQTDKSFKDCVKNDWENQNFEGNEIWKMKEKLKSLKKRINTWNKEVFGSLQTNLINLEQMISNLDTKDEQGGLNEDEKKRRKSLFADLKNLCLKIEMLNRQKSRIKWLQEGDLNTQFFATILNRLNGVFVGNEWCEEPSRVKGEVLRFYKEIFTGSREIQLLLDNVPFPNISSEDNRALIKVISMEEVKQVVWDCDSNKSPGPDGFNFSFLKNSGRL